MTVETLGKKISRLRDLKGWSQEKLSLKAKIARRTLQNIEGGKVMSPGIEVVAAIAKQLGITVSELIEEKNPNKDRNEMISNIVLSLSALDYDQLRSIAESIDSLPPSSGLDSKTTTTE